MQTREIVFPQLRSFFDVFPTWTHAKERAPQPLTFGQRDCYFTRKGNMRERTVSVEVGPYCGVHDAGGYRALYVEAAPAVADYIRKNWIGAGDGSFRVTVRADGTALITAEYSQIIGSHWLALVDASTVPAEVR